MSGVRLLGRVKAYGSIQVPHQTEREVAEREYVVLIYPSGCGKSTTPRKIAGLEEIGDGNLTIDHRLVNSVTVDWLPQANALFEVGKTSCTTQAIPQALTAKLSGPGPENQRSRRKPA